jgi:hypothetical protein
VTAGGTVGATHGAAGGARGAMHDAAVVAARAGILKELPGQVGEPQGAQSPEGSPVLAGEVPE